ncbi:MAG TPA: protein kinase [Gemmatimonadaceae bacterium]|nr:protein kinase [Gemmatimonadaceae bacterium]
MTDYLRDRLVAAVGDHYLIEDELGRGGMAAVFGALDVRLNRRVAIKVLPPEHAFNGNVRSRFMREAQTAAALSHANIVPIYMVDEADGLVYFVMARVDGDSVAVRLGRDGAFSFADVRSVVSEVADALDYAHRHGVVHRDIKPDNILLDRTTRRAMVTDFGIARAAAEEQRLTVTGMAVGTPAYMSPEQAMGERELDGRSDIYSLGVVAYQMLAGETPFQATNTPAMLMKHVSEAPPSLRARRNDIPSGLVYAVERALAKRPEDRWATAGAMRDALLEPMGHHAVAVPVVAAPAREVPAVPRHVPPPAPEPRSEGRLYPPGYPEPSMREAQRRLVPVPPVYDDPPEHLTRSERKEWYRQRREAQRYGGPFDAPRGQGLDERIGNKIARFRRSVAGYFGISFMLFVINMLSSGGDPPWFLFPAMGMMVGLLYQLGSLWGDGVTLKQAFFGPVRRNAAEIAHVPEAQTVTDAANSLVARDILRGPHGRAIQRAVEARKIVTDILKRMTPKEREMLPKDLENTVSALVERVASLGTTLHRLDADANGGSLATLDERIAQLKRDPQTTDRERRLGLLERQRATLHDLLDRRAALLSQMESASLALDTLKLDLVRFRSAGVASALEDVSSATREARAVSRDIEHMLDAHDEMRKL